MVRRERLIISLFVSWFPFLAFWVWRTEWSPRISSVSEEPRSCRSHPSSHIDAIDIEPSSLDLRLRGDSGLCVLTWPWDVCDCAAKHSCAFLTCRWWYTWSGRKRRSDTSPALIERLFRTSVQLHLWIPLCPSQLLRSSWSIATTPCPCGDTFHDIDERPVTFTAIFLRMSYADISYRPPGLGSYLFRKRGFQGCHFFPCERQLGVREQFISCSGRTDLVLSGDQCLLFGNVSIKVMLFFFKSESQETILAEFFL